MDSKHHRVTVELMKDWLRVRLSSLPHIERPARPESATGADAVLELDRPSREGLRQPVFVVMLDGCVLGSVVQGLSAAAYQVLVILGLPPALDALAASRPGLVVVCGSPTAAVYATLRRATTVPILALVTQAGEADVLSVLAAGVDDCQPATIGSQELLSRVRTLLRRAA